MKILVTGAAGFIGFHLAKLLLENDHYVHGYDGMTNYYDVSLKEKRIEILTKYPKFSFSKSMLEDMDALNKVANDFDPKVIIHLAAQAGVRYSLENPRSYIDSNLIGTFNILELARVLDIKHLLMASTSSVYGGNTKMPFIESEKADTPLTIYAATKKANEAMAHSYSHLWHIPTTMFRFFTVYGPWGRPDMALFKFTQAILREETIDVYNYGEMIRDFTYVSDLVNAIMLLMDTIPRDESKKNLEIKGDSLSSVAPFRIVNIGNSQKVQLIDFIKAIEKELGKEASKNLMPMQTGDVPATWANNNLLKELTGFTPETDYKQGVKMFVNWYLDFYKPEDKL